MKDVDYLKSKDFASLLEVAYDEDALDTSEIPPATTREVHRNGIAADELEEETDEEKIEVREESIYGDLPDLEEMIIQSVIQTSLTETSMATPSRFGTVGVTPGTEAQD
ncbi:hypothetical protein H5410_022418 [Solanum commersonii]|uniref:Polyprotein protein n=1 Tax=Solanum commersonii TaxID=4109 RepID=A0A9J5ZE38_SOLCO|nr:hypothetical protein H5410_022418 [Solanum commersonii]